MKIVKIHQYSAYRTSLGVFLRAQSPIYICYFSLRFCGLPEKQNGMRTILIYGTVRAMQ